MPPNFRQQLAVGIHTNDPLRPGKVGSNRDITIAWITIEDMDDAFETATCDKG